MTLNFAHRGDSGNHPENTMLAFAKAVEAGADGIELDVQLSRDGVPMICHDELLDRTTNGTHTGPLCYRTAAELQAMDVSYRFPRFAGRADCRIPTLEEYLAFIAPTGLATNIELKTSVIEYPGIERKVYDLICRFGVNDRILISSFNHHSVVRMQQFAPELDYGFLTCDTLIGAGEYTVRHGVPCYHPEYHSLSQPIVDELKQHGVRINCYTVNDPDDVRDLAAKGIDIVIGNYPARTMAVLRECGAHE